MPQNAHKANSPSQTMPQFVSVKQVAAHFSISVSSVWRGASQGTMPKPIKINGLTRWRRSDIEAVGADPV